MRAPSQANTAHHTDRGTVLCIITHTHTHIGALAWAKKKSYMRFPSFFSSLFPIIIFSSSPDTATVVNSSTRHILFTNTSSTVRRPALFLYVAKKKKKESTLHTAGTAATATAAPHPPTHLPTRTRAFVPKSSAA